MAKILIVEDDIAIAELERDYLEANGHETVLAFDGVTGLGAAENMDFDMILLDIMLPQLNGYEVCRELRKRVEVPILMVSAKGEDLDKVKGLGLGADDYLVKPFSPSELVARVSSHLARYSRLTSKRETDRDIIEVGGLVIDTVARSVTVDGKEISLTSKEFDLLLFLAMNPNEVFSRDALFDKIWGLDSIGETSTVTVHINRIREKIEDDKSSPRYIETLWGSGYRFKGEK